MADSKANPDGEDIEEPPAENDAFPKVEDIVDSTEKVLNQQPAYDKLVNAEILLQLDDKNGCGKGPGPVSW